jgi:radical SAM superfamily enzyme YgiQ (UPF0313 family)
MVQLTEKKKLLLIDLPVFPKGIISLSLPLLAGHLKNDFQVILLDFNLYDWNVKEADKFLSDIDTVGIKVSAQSFAFAKEITLHIKSAFKAVKVIWGGELPTLLPNECLSFADSIVTKRIEGCLSEFISDIKNDSLKRMYEGGGGFNSGVTLPDFSFYNHNRYYEFMGFPLETSSGCDRYCNFCMVHTMQKGIAYKSSEQIQEELKIIGTRFLNVVDYNLGMDKEHLLMFCSEVKKSKITGWMGEMCLESLDDDDILNALSESKCRIIYCGLESIDVNKSKTNHPENYKRIISKAQARGINIASGFIIGLDGTTPKTFDETINYFISFGLIYVKITFLTYNPGTFYHNSMKKNGVYLTENIEKFDGNNLTYLPGNLDKEVLFDGTKKFIRDFYSINSIFKRAFFAEKNFFKRLEFILFNILYSNAYFLWLKYDLPNDKEEGFSKLLNKKFYKSPRIVIAEKMLSRIRKLNN